MRKSFEEILGLNADEFARYFNSKVAEALGRPATVASLHRDELGRIKELCNDLYEKLQKARELHLAPGTSKEQFYSQHEEAHIEAAKAVLQRGFDLAPAPGGAGAAGVGSVPAAGARAADKSPLASLPADAQKSIASYLLPREHVELCVSSRSLANDLKGALDPARTIALRHFLQHVARGQQNEAEAMLRADLSLLTQSSEFTDYSGRRFMCSAYEYAYWAKDTHMCRMLERYMDDDAKTIRGQRIDRMEAIDPATGQAKGLVYWQNGAQHRSAHFDITPLINALQAFVRNFDVLWADPNKAAIQAACLKVGLAQRELPAHVAQEYCRQDRRFYPCPSFDEPILPRHVYFDDGVLDLLDLWFPLPSVDSGLGFDFLIMRGAEESAHSGSFIGYRPRPGVGRMEDDIAALRRLDEVRTAELRLSRGRLSPSVPSAGPEAAAGGAGAAGEEPSYSTRPRR